MPRRYHGLKKPKIRQDWSKESLYNLTRVTTPPAANRTFFQQKWSSKSMARAYHNPYVREGQWTRLFDRQLPAVVSMSHQYLAKYDGSEMASGRGLGVERDPQEEEDERRQRREGGAGRDVVADTVERRPDGRVEKTPYMAMTFFPLERRLDTAIWRALFASSARQARQFVTHGWVKVNGKRMIYPSYALNPGDMFSVDPERVMFATGAKKRRRESPISDEADGEAAEGKDGRKSRAAIREEEAALKEAEEEDGEDSAATAESNEGGQALATKPEDEQDARKALKDLVARAKRLLADSKRELSGKRQQELRAFAQSVRRIMSKHGSDAAADDGSVAGLELALASILSKIPADNVPAASASAAQSAATAAAIATNPQMRDPDKDDAYVARRDAQLLHDALEKARANPVDATKAYATPWRPRAFMSAFAFIPRYLEVNQNVCSAVYLRHPVARPGLAEVPTPFGAETMALAFNWYLRRR
ncbi:hypothetical protein LTR53_004549 [Teratosphaeriaceae sp. CCFEE 6253]|nr:hypothetical protein LTR53_004549 [Teratosphaeriaceae sp. CCFEE 6253]